MPWFLKSKMSDFQIAKIFRLVDFQSLYPKFVLSQEPKVWKIKGSSFGNRPSMFDLKGWYGEPPNYTMDFCRISQKKRVKCGPNSWKKYVPDGPLCNENMKINNLTQQLFFDKNNSFVLTFGKVLFRVADPWWFVPPRHFSDFSISFSHETENFHCIFVFIIHPS